MAPLFKRKEKTTIAELEEYYANQNKRRSGMAWFMAFLSILITIVIIVGLFFAGRWLYRTIVDDDSSSDTTTSDTSSGESVDLPSYDSDELGGDRGLSFTEGSSDNPDDLVVDDTATSSDGTVSDEAASTDEPNADRIASGSEDATSDPNIGGEGSVAGSSSEDNADDESDTVTEVPNTGAGETTLVILLAVSVLGYFGSRRQIIKNSK